MAIVAIAGISDLDAPAGAGRDWDGRMERPLPARSQTMIKGIKFASVPVSDQDRALAFYTEKLGFAVATDQPFTDKQRWIELRIPGAATGLVLFTPEDRKSVV